MRDSRAVANSWSKAKIRNPGFDQNTILLKFSVVNASKKWLVNNFLFQLLKYHGQSSYSLIKYEDFATDPHRALTEITQKFDVQDNNFSFLSGQVADIKNTHLIAGNPVRFQSGKITIIPDVEWEESMSKLDRFM